MAKIRKKKSRPAKPLPRTEEPSKQLTWIYFVLLVVATVVCFFPLLRYFFAQDDFILINIVVRDGGRAFLEFFSREPGLFRPFTKAFYFGAMYNVFGLNPIPFHVISILVHALNSILVFLLMKRCRVGTTAGLVSTTLFALSVAFFHVIGWISCIQQLLGQCFMLAVLLFGIEYLRSGSKRAKWASIAAYVLALLSLEQTFAAPVILLAFAHFNIGRWKEPLPVHKALGKLIGHISLMAAYLLLVVVYKGAPQDGAYTLAFGGNVIKNLSTYLAWTLHFGAVFPRLLNLGIEGLAKAHIVLAALLIYQLYKRRFRALMFGLSYFLLTILPTLFLQNHTYYLHTYVAVFGILYLVALVVDDVLSVSVFRRRAARYAVLFVVLVGVAATSFVMVRKNEKYKMFRNADYVRSFVLRRAMTAKNVYDSVIKGKSQDKNVEKVYMVYGRRKDADQAKWNKSNVQASIGRGSLVRLMYGKLDMPVIFRDYGDEIEGSELNISDIYFYDDFGNSRKLEMIDTEEGN